MIKAVRLEGFQGRQSMGHGGDGAADTCGAMLDRSKVHILLCDKDPESGLQVMKLLQKCSYQVMSLQDEMALVVRCLKLGAVDFLLKPLRRNELLNLWTHTWRRRRMLGLTEKHLMKGNLRVPLDLLVAETSESNNTNSTNLLSDDTEDHKVATMSIHPMESEMSPRLELSLKPSVDLTLEVTSEHGAGSLLSPPRKSELKVGQSSAFLTYSKLSNQPIRRSVESTHFDASSSFVQLPGLGPELRAGYHDNDDSDVNNREEQQPGGPTSYVAFSEELLADRRPYPWASAPCRNEREIGYREHSGPSGNYVPLPGDLRLVGKPHFSDHFSHEAGAASGTSIAPHFLAGGMIGSVMHCPPMLPPAAVQMYQSLSTEDGFLFTGINAAGIPSVYMPQGLNLTSTFPFYPFGLHVAANSPQLGSFSGWHPAMQNAMLVERKVGQAERREAALNKFRLKRKDRCFEKKIRYVSRKKLAEQRPRIRGQFVRMENDTDTGVVDDYYEDDDDQGISCDLGDGPSPEDG